MLFRCCVSVTCTWPKWCDKYRIRPGLCHLCINFNTLLKLVTCYLLLVTDSFTGYWFGLLVIDSFTGYWFGLLVTDSVYWLLIRFISFCLLIRITGYWFGLLVTGSFTGYWFVYWLLIRFTSYWFGLLVTGSNYWLLIRVTSYWFIYWLLIRFTDYWFGLLFTGYWFDLLITDSGYYFTGYWFNLLVTDSGSWWLICLLVTDSIYWFWFTGYWFGLLVRLLVTDSFTGYWFDLLVIASPPKPLEEFSGNLAYEFLSISRCVCRKIILLRQQIWPNCGNL